MSRIESWLTSLVLLAAISDACLPNGVRGCDCAAQPGCGPCASQASQSYGYSQDSAYQQSYQPSYQAPPAQYQPPPPALPAAEYQPPPINLPGQAAPPAPIEHYQSGPSSPASGGQYPSQEYLQMLAPDHGQPQQQQIPPSGPTNAPVAPPVTPKIESYREVQHTIVNSGRPGAIERSDQTAYREGYKSEHGEAVARFESGSIIAPPPEDPPNETEGKEEGDDYGQEPPPQSMTLSIQKISSTQAYVASTPAATPPPATTTVPPTAAVYKQAPQEYAAVLKEPVEERKMDQFYTYNDQVCTGIVMMRSKETAVVDAARKCLDMQCVAANIRGSADDDKFEVVYLKAVDGRKDSPGFYCISVKNIPTFGNDFDKIENEIKLHKKVGRTGSSNASSRFQRHRYSEKRRAPASYKLQATTFRPRIFRVATIEPKSSY